MLRWWDGGQWSFDVRPVDAATPSGQAPSAGSLRPVGDWMTETFRLIVNNAGALLTLAVILIVPASLVAAIGTWYGIRDLVFSIDEDAVGNPFSFEGTGGLPLVAAALVINLILTVVYSIGGTRLAMSSRFGNKMGWSEALSSGFSRILPVFGWSIVGVALFMVALAVMVGITAVAGVVNPGLGIPVGLVLFVVGGLALYGRYSMILSSPIVAAKGSRNPRTVHRITMGSTWGLIGRVCLLLLITTAASFAGSALSSPLASIGGTQPIEQGDNVIRFTDLLGGNVGIFMLVQLMSAIVGALTVLLWHVGQSTLFEDLGGEIDPVLRSSADSGQLPL